MARSISPRGAKETAPSWAQTAPASWLCEMLLRQSPGCSWVLNRDQSFQAVYGDTSRVFGRAAAELPALNFCDLFEPPARFSWMTRVERVWTGEALCAAGRFGDGPATYSIALFPVRSPEGEIAFAGGIAREVGERDLTLRVLQALEADRTRLSQLLHDHVGQYLSAAGLKLDLLRMDLAESGFPVSERTQEIQAMLETIMELVRDFSHELNPAVAERIGLRAALDRMAGRLRADFKGTVRLLTDPKAHTPPEAAAALYRIAQEAAGNAVRHAGCSAIEILLKSSRSGPSLEIRDNGRGFDSSGGALRGRGLGLLVMEQCAEQAGIDLRIDSAPGKGTVVRALCRSGDRIGAG